MAKSTMDAEVSSELLCLVCNSSINGSCCTNIFHKVLLYNGDILANFISELLQLALTDVQSSHVCARCCNLFELLQQAQWTAANIKNDILKSYQRTKNSVHNTSHKTIENISNEKISDIFNKTDKVEQILKYSVNDVNTVSFNSKQFIFDKTPKNKVINLNNDSKLSISTAEKISNNKLIDAIVNKVPDNKFGNILYQDESKDKEYCKEMAEDNKMPFKYTCSVCNKKWRTAGELKCHMISHSDVRPYMCEKCGQAYKHKHALDVHIGMHNGINPFQCNFCNKCFTQKGALMRHLPIHTGEAPYQCELCGKRFIHHTSYNMHSLSHTGQKSYKCHICDLSLLSTSHLKRHMRVHTGEKPFSCMSCNKKFAERYNLFAHQKVHALRDGTPKQTNKFKCDKCDATFSRKRRLDEHLKSHASSVTCDKLNKNCIDHITEVRTKSLPKIQSVVTISKLAEPINLCGAEEQPWLDINYLKSINLSPFITLDEKCVTDAAIHRNSPKIITASSNENVQNP